MLMVLVMEALFVIPPELHVQGGPSFLHFERDSSHQSMSVSVQSKSLFCREAIGRVEMPLLKTRRTPKPAQS